MVTFKELNYIDYLPEGLISSETLYKQWEESQKEAEKADKDKQNSKGDKNNGSS